MCGEGVIVRRIGLLILSLLVIAAGWAAPAIAQQVFRSTVDLIAVDVQVVDRDGHPVLGLPIDRFAVTIDGRRRRVVTAELVDYRPWTRTPGAAGADSPRPAESPAPPPRVFLIAVDGTSFRADQTQGVLTSARAFVDRLPPDDLVGLFAYPHGPRLSPTTNHADIARAIGSITGERDPGGVQEFHLRPSELVELSTWVSGYGSGQGRDLALRICGDSNPDEQAQCLKRLEFEVKSALLTYEGQANASLGELRSFLDSLSVLPGRKTVVLVSAGIVASDVPGGRPDISDLGNQVGKAAAQGNVAVYTLFIDRSLIEQFSAETRRSTVTQVNLARDSELLLRWLDQFSGAAGGSLVKVATGNTEPAFDRILRETSAYYLLGVELAQADRDGRVHQILVKVNERGATVHGRSWVAVPKTGGVAPVARLPAAPAVDVPAAPPPPPPPPRPLSPEVQGLVDVFEHGDYASFQRRIVETKDLAAVLRDFRTGGSPWPDAPHRTAVLALELALAGLRRDNGFARDEGARLLSQYHALVRQPSGADPFECSWYWAEAAGLEGLIRPAIALPFVSRGADRCPQDGRLQLALAVLTEQQFWFGETPAFENGRFKAATSADDQNDVKRRYENAMKFPESAVEARLRLAWFCQRTGQIDRALELVDARPDQSADRQLDYLTDLVRGQIFRASGRLDAAEAALRAALTGWPGAQSARVALMTLLLDRGSRQDASALADDVLRGTEEQPSDPWWTFRSGDYRNYVPIMARLRDMAR